MQNATVAILKEESLKSFGGSFRVVSKLEKELLIEYAQLKIRAANGEEFSDKEEERLGELWVEVWSAAYLKVQKNHEAAEFETKEIRFETFQNKCLQYLVLWYQEKAFESRDFVSFAASKFRRHPKTNAKKTIFKDRNVLRSRERFPHERHEADSYIEDDVVERFDAPREHSLSGKHRVLPQEAIPKINDEGKELDLELNRLSSAAAHEENCNCPRGVNRRLDLFLFVAGVSSDQFELPLSGEIGRSQNQFDCSYEIEAYNSLERRTLVLKEWCSSRKAKKRFKKEVKQKYWRLLRHESVWSKVVYPLVHLRDSEFFPTWSQPFLAESLGAVIGSLITGGWCFFESSDAWFSRMRQFNFKNKATANFLNATYFSKNMKTDVMGLIGRLYTGKENLDQHWQVWRSENADAVEHIRIAGDQMLPSSGKETRSYTCYLDLPFQSKEEERHTANRETAIILKRQRRGP